MSQRQKGIAKPSLRGRKRPAHSAMMKEHWTNPDRVKIAREHGARLSADKEWRLRIAEQLTGDKNPRWLGGMSATRYAPGFSKALKLEIRQRDNFRCQLCGARESELGYRLTIHHSDYDKANHDPDNLFSTCKPCNSRVNSNRDIWSVYFIAAAEHRRQFGQNVGDLIGSQIITQSKQFATILRDGHPAGFESALQSVLTRFARF